MANYSGGGGGGASVVPATFVVASDREDYPLTEAGLAAAIADLPAGGGTIYIGEGTLTITAPITVSKNVKFIGAGRATVLSIVGAITGFSIDSSMNVTFDSMNIEGDSTVGSILVLNVDDLLGSGTLRFINLASTGMETILDMAGVVKTVTVSNCDIFAGSTAQVWIANAADGSLLTVTGSSLTGDIIPDVTLSTVVYASASTIAGGAGTSTFGPGSVISSCNILSSQLVFQDVCLVSSSEIDGSVSLTMGANCIFSGCYIAGDVVAAGGNIQITGCLISSFTSSDTLDAHIITGNVFIGAGVFLANTDLCIVAGNIDCDVTESGTADGNRYDNNTGFLGSTIIGPTSVVNGGGPVLFYTFPGTVDIASNAEIQFASLPNAVMIRRLRATIKTAPTGQALIVDFKKVTLSTGVVGASIGTVSIAAGAFEGTANVLSPAVSLAITEGLAMEVTQVGSIVAGANLSGFADCFA